MPAGILKKLERIRKSFLWGGGGRNHGIPWVAWNTVICDKSYGGLRVRSLRSLNIGLMLKWWWRLKCKPETLWCRIISSIHNLVRKPAHHLAKRSATGACLNIVNIHGDLEEFGFSFDSLFRKTVGSGNNTLF